MFEYLSSTMLKYFRIPFYWLFLAGLLGLLLRLHLAFPFRELVYKNWLHAHSHLMFLGWIFNFLNLAFVYHYIEPLWDQRYKVLFLINQVLLVGMAIFFPLYGYGVITIPLSTLHTLVSIVISVRFIRDSRSCRTDFSRWLAMWALIFFMISSLGPFALAPIMINGLNHTKWYFFAVYFYLHFQYNGFFLFGVLALIFRHFEGSGVVLQWGRLRLACSVLVICAFATYVLSILWSNPGIGWNVFGFTSALVQLLVFAWILFEMGKSSRTVLTSQSRVSRILLTLATLSFALKFLLQVGSAHPWVVSLTYDNRYVVIAYLHLVLVGGVTFFVLGWYLVRGFIGNLNMIFLIMLLTGFICSELLLVGFTAISSVTSETSSLILVFSVVMFFGIVGFFLKAKDL